MELDLNENDNDLIHLNTGKTSDDLDSRFRPRGTVSSTLKGTSETCASFKPDSLLIATDNEIKSVEVENILRPNVVSNPNPVSPRGHQGSALAHQSDLDVNTEADRSLEQLAKDQNILANETTKSKPEVSQQHEAVCENSNHAKIAANSPSYEARESAAINQLVMEQVPEYPLEQIREIEDRSIARSARTYSLAHLKIGMHATKEATPSWQYALLDSGCTDNLISINSLKTMADFSKIDISASTATTIKTANNDASQQIHGKVNLLISIIDTNGRRLCFRSSFLVVSGLVYDIFLGQPFLTSPQINHETKESLFFNPADCIHFNSRNVPSFSKSSADLQEVRKTYHLRKRATCTKRTVIPPKTAQKVKTNILFANDKDRDKFYSFKSSQKFIKKHPRLHIMHQTVQPNDNSNLEIMVLNTTDHEITIKRNAKLGSLESHNKSGTIIHQLSDFVHQDRPLPSKEEEVNLNLVSISASRSKVIYDPKHDEHLVSCNAAYTASMHEHPLDEKEKAERNSQYRQEGFFQKSVSEVIEEARNIPSMDFQSKDQFNPKSDEELLAGINLDHLSDEHKQLTLDMLKRNIHAFQRHPLDIGKCENITAFAPLTTPDPPILYAKYVPIPLKYKEPAQFLIDQYCAAGVLAPTTEPAKFTSNIFIIPKKDGTFRLIFDGRILSKYCQNLPLALGSYDEIFASLAGKDLVSKLDISKAYDQIPVTPETSKLLSFFGPDCKRYVYLRAGQGLKFSSFFLTQAMDEILFGIPSATSYCDDVFIATSSTFEHHLAQIETVIQRFASYNVKLSISKLEIAPKSLDFLGLTWSKDKLSIPKSKITAYINLKTPKSYKEARFIVNSMAFYRRFLPNFSETIAPILDLLKETDKMDKKTRKFNWTEVHQNAVNKLIKQIENGVSLYLPRKDRKFIIHTDASNIAAGATVTQYDDEGRLQLVAAVSRSFIKSERNLAPVQKEILALLYTLTSLNYLLKGAEIDVYADAKSLTLLKTCSTSSPYLSRLAMELSQYNFNLFHLEGRLNIESDALSRLTKTQDKIIQDDKTKNNAMTRDESLLFLEYLLIPNNVRFTQSEVRHLISSEPLKSELVKKVKARIPDMSL